MTYCTTHAVGVQYMCITTGRYLNVQTPSSRGGSCSRGDLSDLNDTPWSDPAVLTSNPDASLYQGPDQRCPIGALHAPPSSIYLSFSDLCSCNSVYVQYLNLLFIQPISLSVHYIGVHHGTEHPRCDCGGAVLYADSGDRSVGCPKVQEGWEEEPWRSDRSGAPRRQEYQLAGWNFHHDWYVGLWGSETFFFFFVMFNF